MTDLHKPTLAAPDDDPRIWLEDVDAPAATAWVDARSAQTRQAFFGSWAQNAAKTLQGIMERPDRIPYVRRRGGLLYNFWRDAENPRGLWRRCTLESFRTPKPEWDVLLDLDALAEADGEDWVWAGAAVARGAGRAILSLSRGGADAVSLREYDLATRTIAAGGFELGEAKGGADWLDDDTLMLSSAYGPDRATQAGYARSVRVWRRGTAVEDARTIFEVDPAHMMAFGDVDRSSGSERLWFGDLPGFFETVLHLGDRDGPRQRLDLPSDAEVDARGDHFTVKLRTEWTVGGQTYAPDTVLGGGLNDWFAGRRALHPLFTPDPERALQGVGWSGPWAVLSFWRHLAPVFELWRPGPAGWTRQDGPAVPEVSAAHVWSVDAEPEEATGELLVNVETPVAPATLSLAAPGGAPEALAAAPAVFAADALAVSRHWARSSDGAQIPYTQVGPADASGEAPVFLTGYGGFGLSETPGYRGGIGKLWLEAGGLYVIAHIRGGGEYGVRWHEAGRGAGKTLSHDDFAAVAKDLVDRGVTRPSRIAAEGGSNGGLLIANMFTRYPERFGALHCTIPLIDMRRYTQLLAGASWIAEYGDPSKPEDWTYLQKVSAYHHALDAPAYPPMLIATTRRDDRVHPGHARKMAAKLQEQGLPVHLYEQATGGHGAGKNAEESAQFIALGWAFLRQSIGWTA